jgi:hypothetical protein
MAPKQTKKSADKKSAATKAEEAKKVEAASNAKILSWANADEAAASSSSGGGVGSRTIDARVAAGLQVRQSPARLCRKVDFSGPSFGVHRKSSSPMDRHHTVFSNVWADFAKKCDTLAEVMTMAAAGKSVADILVAHPALNKMGVTRMKSDPNVADEAHVELLKKEKDENKVKKLEPLNERVGEPTRVKILDAHGYPISLIVRRGTTDVSQISELFPAAGGGGSAKGMYYPVLHAGRALIASEGDRKESE